MKTNQIVVGILAHVDAGKTTLSEAILYKSGSIRKVGRVDNKDAFLDTYTLEKERGITIFSKQARFTITDRQVTLLDTPGHVDFSAEMERTLQVLDYAILVISGADGVQGHTQTLWRLLRQYEIPVFLFVNKMDQPGCDRSALLQDIQTVLGDTCVDFQESDPQVFYENIAMCEEEVMEEFLATGKISRQHIRTLIARRKLFPCFFGSALKLTGIEEFLEGLSYYTTEQTYEDDFGARVYKIARDAQGNRLTYLKVTGGTMKVKMQLKEKINQIRIYSGEKYEMVNEAPAGTICAVTGLTDTYPGEGLGIESQTIVPLLEPVQSYQLQLPDGTNPTVMLSQLKQLEEEIPELHIVWNEKLRNIQAQVMGEVQIEILQKLIWDRFGVDVTFGSGRIVYKETISSVVEGVGHFEPLRHYAEVHLVLEPLEAGSGMEYQTDCSEDMLDKNWQRLILTHLKERSHVGVLTGSEITDIRITLVAGKAHVKHTEGGDFRQATYRAIRQGLMQAESVLLEPYYEFVLEVPENMVGRAMADIEKMSGRFEPPQIRGQMAELTGSAPVATMNHYQKEVIAYTKGYGKLALSFKGYEPCHNTDEVLALADYDPQRDVDNPTGSVFCAHGAGYIVPWDEVTEHMHLPAELDAVQDNNLEERQIADHKSRISEEWIETDEIDAILDRTYNANRRNGSSRKGTWTRQKAVPSQSSVTRTYTNVQKQEEYLLVDGYNVIYAWDELKELADINIDGARGRLLDILCNYQGIRHCNLIVVFDAYRVKGHSTEILDYHNIHVVYTREAETADAYIEKFAHENGRRYHITVATSDGLEQIIIRGAGCRLLSSREFYKEVEYANAQMREQMTNGTEKRSCNETLGNILKKI